MSGLQGKLLNAETFDIFSVTLADVYVTYGMCECIKNICIYEDTFV